LNSPNATLAADALPLAALWDKQGTLAGEAETLLKQITAKLNDASQPDDKRVQLATSLLAARSLNSDVVPAVARMLGSGSSSPLETRIIAALGKISET